MIPTNYVLTRHALDQMDARGVSREAVEYALAYGRTAWTRGSCIFAIGRRDVARAERLGLNLQPFEGVQVVTAPDGTILTVYRNRDLRGLRDLRRGCRRPQIRSHNQRILRDAHEVAHAGA